MASLQQDPELGTIIVFILEMRELSHGKVDIAHRHTAPWWQSWDTDLDILCS